MTTLYNITNELSELDALIDAAGGELTPEIEALLDHWQAAKDTKLANISALIKNWESDAEQLKAEEARLYEMRKSLERRSEKLRDYVTNLIGIGTGWTNGVHTFKWRESVRVEADMEYLPGQYRRVKQEPDKVLIKKDLESGAKIPGAELVKSWNLLVK